MLGYPEKIRTHDRESRLKSHRLSAASLFLGLCGQFSCNCLQCFVEIIDLLCALFNVTPKERLSPCRRWGLSAGLWAFRCQPLEGPGPKTVA
jgi:hypothetical protein